MTALVGCSDSMNVQVQSAVPSALVQTLPLKVGVFYDDALKNHRYTENTNERRNWEVASGASQVAMFDQVLGATFSEVTHLNALPSPGATTSHDIVIAPAIQEIQLATPQETYFEFFEAWIRYDIDLLDNRGVALGTWQITAYGKAPKKRFARRTDGVNDAFSLALRDAGAKLVTSVLQQPAVVEKLSALK